MRHGPTGLTKARLCSEIPLACGGPPRARRGNRLHTGGTYLGRIRDDCRCVRCRRCRSLSVSTVYHDTTATGKRPTGGRCASGSRRTRPPPSEATAIQPTPRTACARRPPPAGTQSRSALPRAVHTDIQVVGLDSPADAQGMPAPLSFGGDDEGRAVTAYERRGPPRRARLGLRMCRRADGGQLTATVTMVWTKVRCWSKTRRSCRGPVVAEWSGRVAAPVGLDSDSSHVLIQVTSDDQHASFRVIDMNILRLSSSSSLYTTHSPTSHCRPGPATPRRATKQFPSDEPQPGSGCQWGTAAPGRAADGPAARIGSLYNRDCRGRQAFNLTRKFKFKWEFYDCRSRVRI